MKIAFPVLIYFIICIPSIIVSQTENVEPESTQLEEGINSIIQQEDDLMNFQTTDLDIFQSDNRAELPFTFQLSAENIVFWGITGGYNINRWLQVGLSYHTYQFTHILLRIDTNIEFDINVDSLNNGDNTRVNTNIDSVFDYYNIYLRYYPIINSGFFGQLGIIYRDWVVNTKLIVKEYDLLSSLINSELAANINITTPKNGFDIRLGWSWLNKFGFTNSVGAGLMIGNEVQIDLISEKLISGDNIFSDEEIEQTKKDLLNNLFIFRNLPVFFFSFGKNF